MIQDRAGEILKGQITETMPSLALRITGTIASGSHLIFQDHLKRTVEKGLDGADYKQER